MVPFWLHLLALGVLLFGVLCALGIAWDIARHPQPMAIMNVVWPVAALFGTAWVVWQYARYGREAHGQRRPSPPPAPFAATVANGALHCGSGCMLGDICAECLIFLVPSVAVLVGWHRLYQNEMYAAWIVDFLFAYAFGIIFQYFAIKPMRDVSAGAALWAAIKADTLSLTFWQIGMYGFMAFASLYLGQRVLGITLRPDMAAFWFAMQIAMLCGFVTAYPVNWWLIRAGVKEKM